MTSQILPANSGLIGIALIVRSRDGPRFVFHYPERLTSDEKREKPRYGTELDPTTPEASDVEDSSDDDDLDDDPSNLRRSIGRMGLGNKRSHHVSPWDGDEHFDNVDGVQVVPWEHVDAFPTKDLASILTPARAYHKKAFELTLDPIHFVTYPMYVRPDGNWKKVKKQKKKKTAPQDANGTENTKDAEASGADSENEETSPLEPDTPTDGKTTTSSNAGTESGLDDGGMTMFNLVFMMNPSRLEASARVQNIFEHVVKDMNKALRYAQHYDNYVWRESNSILLMKERGREDRIPMGVLWKEILQKSSLARAMRDLHVSIARNEIATVSFDSKPPIRLSLQIPQPFFLTMPPDVDEEAMPGLPINTANCMEDQDGDDNPILNRDYALLLLQDEDKIIADIQAQGGELAAPLIQYLQVLKPTLSFAQTAQQNAISLSDIRLLAQHLIYYRLARAIPPLHARDTYIISPNAPFDTLPTASATWTSLFPLSPPLPNFLSLLSAAPRPYKTFAPTKSHRPKYLDMLAFLLRHAFVTQLRTFAYVIVWPELRYEVEYALDAERIKNAYEEAIADALEEATSQSPSSPTPLSSEATAEKARVQRLREKAKQDSLDFAKRPKPLATLHPSVNAAEHLRDIHPRIIKDPYRADAVDSLYLEAIGKRFGSVEGGTEKEREQRKGWMRLAKYWDGRQAIEMVGLREGMKRREAWEMVFGFEEFLLTLRHW